MLDRMVAVRVANAGLWPRPRDPERGKSELQQSGVPGNAWDGVFKGAGRKVPQRIYRPVSAG